MIKFNKPPLVTVHTPVVDDVNSGVNPEVELATNVGAAPKFCAPGLVKVITCAALGVTLFDAPEAKLVPTPLVAVTVKL